MRKMFLCLWILIKIVCREKRTWKHVLCLWFPIFTPSCTLQEYLKVFLDRVFTHYTHSFLKEIISLSSMKSSSDISFQPSTSNSSRVEIDISHIRESTKPSSTMFMSVISFLSIRLRKAVLSFDYGLYKSFSLWAVVLLPHSPLTEELRSSNFFLSQPHMNYYLKFLPYCQVFFMIHEENISLLVDTYQSSVQRKGNLEVRLVTLVSNLCSKLHF